MKSSVSEKRVRANGLEHHIIEWNAAGDPTVMLCHGFLDIAWSWRGVAERLAGAGYRVLAFDWRGHGESDWVGAGGYYHFPDYVLDLQEIARSVSSDRFHLVGHSMGGVACALFAGLASQRLRSLTLIEGLGLPATEPSKVPDRFASFIEKAPRAREARARVMRDVDETLARMRVQNPELTDELGRFLAEGATKPGPGGIGRVWRFDPLHRTTAPTPFLPEVFSAFLARIEVPSLIVTGEKGYRLPDQEVRVKALRDAQTVEISGVGHMVHWHAPEALGQALIAFFVRVDG